MPSRDGGNSDLLGMGLPYLSPSNDPQQSIEQEEEDAARTESGCLAYHAMNGFHRPFNPPSLNLPLAPKRLQSTDMKQVWQNVPFCMSDTQAPVEISLGAPVRDNCSEGKH